VREGTRRGHSARCRPRDCRWTPSRAAGSQSLGQAAGRAGEGGGGLSLVLLRLCRPLAAAALCPVSQVAWPCSALGCYCAAQYDDVLPPAPFCWWRDGGRTLSFGHPCGGRGLALPHNITPPLPLACRCCCRSAYAVAPTLLLLKLKLLVGRRRQLHEVGLRFDAYHRRSHTVCAALERADPAAAAEAQSALAAAAAEAEAALAAAEAAERAAKKLAEWGPATVRAATDPASEAAWDAVAAAARAAAADPRVGSELPSTLREGAVLPDNVAKWAHELCCKLLRDDVAPQVALRLAAQRRYCCPAAVRGVWLQSSVAAIVWESVKRKNNLSGEG
jgi:hypothetical protein